MCSTAIPLDDGTVTTPVTLAMIQALIPLGLSAVEEALPAEVSALAGPRYARTMRSPSVVRWGAQRGLDLSRRSEAPDHGAARAGSSGRSAKCRWRRMPRSRRPAPRDVGPLSPRAGRPSCREYEAAAEAVPEAFGLARSSVSRRFIRASAQRAAPAPGAALDDAEWLVLVLDGKSFAGDELVVALGVTATGREAHPRASCRRRARTSA